MLLESVNLLIIYEYIFINVIFFIYKINDNYFCYNNKILKFNS